jgi:hypothetical protein
MTAGAVRLVPVVTRGAQSLDGVTEHLSKDELSPMVPSMRGLEKYVGSHAFPTLGSEA